MVCTVTGSRSPAKPRSPSWLRHLLAISARDPAGGRTYCCHYDSRVIMLHYTTGSSNWKKVNPQRSVMPQVLVLLDSKTPHGKAFEFLNSTRDDEPRVFQSSNRGAALIFSVPREKAWKGAAPKEANGNKARVGGGSRRRAEEGFVLRMDIQNRASAGGREGRECAGGGARDGAYSGTRSGPGILSPRRVLLPPPRSEERVS
jgi:hypothetical protein